MAGGDQDDEDGNPEAILRLPERRPAPMKRYRRPVCRHAVSRRVSKHLNWTWHAATYGAGTVAAGDTEGIVHRIYAHRRSRCILFGFSRVLNRW